MAFLSMFNEFKWIFYQSDLSSFVLCHQI